LLKASATFNQGTATFSGLTLTRAAAGYQLRFATLRLAALLSSSFNVVGATATRLQITGPTIVRGLQPVALTVTARDAYGNVVTDFSGTVQLTGAGIATATYDFTPANAGSYTFLVQRTSASYWMFFSLQSVQASVVGEPGVLGKFRYYQFPLPS
jgi:hypothetical protein